MKILFTECHGNGCTKRCDCSGCPCNPYTGECSCTPDRKGPKCETSKCLYNKSCLTKNE